MEDINIYKLILRVAKDNENFQELRRNVLTKIKLKQLKITPKQFIKEKIKNSNNLINTYAIILNQHSHINDLSIYITTQIGVDESMELFENFITKNYGINTLESFKNNIDEAFIKAQTTRLPIIQGQTNVKSLPLNAYLLYAFLWSGSKERDSFWRNINIHWEKEYKKIFYDFIEKKMNIFADAKNG
jgi:hypothetical protein